MGIEQSMWNTMRPVMKKAHLHPLRVENKAHIGTPDVNYTDGWIELKCTARWPKRGGPVALKHFTKEQRLWNRERWKYNGGAWVLWKIERDWLLFDGYTASTLLGYGAKDELFTRCAVSAKSFDPVIFVPWLRPVGGEALSPGSMSRYYRLRALKTVDEVAASSGFSVNKIVSMETGGEAAHELLDYWLS